MAIKISGETVIDDDKKGLFNDVVANGGVRFAAGQLVESVNVVAGTLDSASDIDLSNGMVHYFTERANRPGGICF